MINIEEYILVLLPIALSPGTSFILAMSNVAKVGLRGIVPILMGTGLGLTLHSLVAGIGVSVLFSQSHLAMNVIRYLVIFFLTCFGIKLFLTGMHSPQPEQDYNKKATGVKAALILNLTNVRAIVFYLTIVPLFSGISVANYFIFSTLHIVILTLWLLACGLCLTVARQKFKLSKLSTLIHLIGGVSLIFLAIRMAV